MSLQRRGSSTVLLRARSKSIPLKPLICYTPIEAPTKTFSPRLPPELLDHIVDLALAHADDDCHVSDFTPIAPLTLASSGLRHIVLRQFFREIIPISKPHWTGLFKLLEAQTQSRAGKQVCSGYDWVRVLRASSRILLHEPMRLSVLTALRVLSIDLMREGLSTQHPALKSILLHLALLGPVSNMRSLTLSSLPRIDIVLLQLITSTFPNLTYLRLSCTERLELSCCWHCFEDSLTCTIHSPIPNDFSDLTVLTHAFADSLKPLLNLARLHLGIFLSDDRLIYTHMAHCIGNNEDSPGMVEGGLICPKCFGKAIEQVRARELEASLIMARELKSLQYIGWSSFFHNDAGKEQVAKHDLDTSGTGEDDRDGTGISGEEQLQDLDDDAGATFLISRSSGSVQVRKILRKESTEGID